MNYSDRMILALFIAINVWCQSAIASAVENRMLMANDAKVESHLQPVVEKPFLPHRANTSTGQLISSEQYDDAQVCGSCHQEIYKEWRSSMMAYAWDDPIYRALLRRASIATGSAVDEFCTGCHTPIGLLTGKINAETNRRPIETEHASSIPGVDCEACHNISGISGVENGSYVMDALHDGQKNKRGPRADAKSPYHNTQYSSLHTQSEFCGTCHNVTHPFNGVPIERTYDEWYESSYRADNVSCQDCHMRPVRGKSALMGPEREDRATHFFAAANTTVMKHFGETENVERARELLHSAAELKFANLPADVTRGSMVSLQLKVHNTGAGHKLPTGFPEGREVWIDLQVVDADGNYIYRLGQVKNGKTEPGTKNFKVHLGDKDGHEVDVEVWKVAKILSDNRLLPKGSQTVDFQFYLPNDAKGPLQIIADLNYWPFSQAFADFLLGEGKLDVDIERLTSIKQTIPLAKNTPQLSMQ